MGQSYTAISIKPALIGLAAAFLRWALLLLSLWLYLGCLQDDLNSSAHLASIMLRAIAAASMLATELKGEETL